MGLIDRIKSALGLGTGPSQPTGGADGPASSDDVDVTVEHEPDTASEDAVKGTDTATTGAAESGAGSETEEEPGDAEATAEPVEADLEDIKGIGPTYAERLREAGIADVGALAEADPDALAEEAGIAESRVSNWVERARQR